jgi:predicted Zn-dependent peptidase
MKKLHSFTDTLTRIEHTTYEYPNGIKLFHAKNPSSIDYVLTVIIRAGSTFETINNLPHGTAHFLEHIISGNPNKLLKSKFEIDEFESGSRDEPEIYTNASTSQKYMYIYSYGNQEGSERINQRIKSILDYPTENITQFIEKERNIILAEQANENKEEHDRHLQFARFIYNNQDSGFIHTIIGEKESIKNITTSDLETFFKQQFTPSNILITLQTGEDLLPSHKDEIEQIVNIFNKKSDIKYPQIDIETGKRIHHFIDEQMEGVSLAMLFPKKYQNKLNYKSETIEYLFRSLMRKISHDYLREKLGLIYSASMSNNFGYSFATRVIGYEVVMQPNNFQKVLNEINHLIDKEIYRFLKSNEGKIWFESMISSYIFPRTIPYSSSYAESKGLPLIEGREVFQLDKAVNEALKVSINDLELYTQQFFRNEILFWIESDGRSDRLTKQLKRSKLYNRF